MNFRYHHEHEENILKTEFSEDFVQKMKNRVATSFHKYGPAKINFGDKLVNAKDSLLLCLKKYEETHNTEYLIDAANYAMFEYMYPGFEDAFFEATPDTGSAGTAGIPYNESLRKAGINPNDT